jgi:hypothetical protein
MTPHAPELHTRRWRRGFTEPGLRSLREQAFTGILSLLLTPYSPSRLRL